ncbi:MAG: hypothetical protein ACJAYH_001817 [Celeribacter sp.]|jgi:hypothetical protein
MNKIQFKKTQRSRGDHVAFGGLYGWCTAAVAIGISMYARTPEYANWDNYLFNMLLSTFLTPLFPSTALIIILIYKTVPPKWLLLLVGIWIFATTSWIGGVFTEHQIWAAVVSV